MDAPEASPPFFPWKLVIKAGDADTREPPSSEQDQELERLGWSLADDGEWLAHLASGWLCNPSEKVFFHAEKSLLVAADISDFLKEDAAEAAAGAASSRGSQPGAEGPDSLDPLVEGCNEDDLPESDEESEIVLDLEDDLDAATFQKKARIPNCEDRFVTRAGLPLGVVAGDTEALCYFTAIYDGHAGSDCADYAAAHLHKNLLSSYRQLYRTVQRRREEELQKQGGGKRRKLQATQWLQQLNQSTHPLRPEERRLSVEMEALVRSCFSAFSLTDKNYLGLSENALTQDAGSTACAAIFFGPDEQGVLQLVTAHAGDSRAVLCRDGQALRLTEDHKPNSALERKRIEAAGGQVVSVQGVWRVLASDARGGRTVGLSTSRALGDLALKKPKPLVISNPTVHVYTLHFDKDAFLVLASDGIFEVLSDEEVVSLILSRLPPTPQAASQLVVDEAVARGGTDDKTCTVIYFKWRKDLFPQKSEEGEAAFTGQPDSPGAESEQRTQRTEISVAEARANLEKQMRKAGAPEGAGGPRKAGSDGEKDESIEGDKEADYEGLDSHAAKKEKAEEARGDGDAAAETPEAATTEMETQNPPEAADAEVYPGSKGVRSSGLEEIAAISTGLDVEALIRKRKRELQKEAEEAAAAAAAAAEAAEEDFDIFGGAPAASPKESDSD
ncbi:hypothetical protein Esti_004467 [Eimeria stiedai]